VSSWDRPLAGIAVGLSISESEDSTAHGFPSWQVNRVTLQVVSALFGQGAAVVFGHDWRDDGVMEAVHGFALQMQPAAVGSVTETGASAQPLLQNVLPWPDQPRLSADDLERLRTTLRVERAGLPPELVQVGAAVESRGVTAGPVYSYLRARGLTHLRRQLNKRCHARICLGGRRGGSSGRYPGVIEEALLAANDHKPLYLAGLLGGATAQIIDAIECRPMPGDFCPRTKVADLYEVPPNEVAEHDPSTRSDRSIDSQSVWSTFERGRVAAVSESNGLSQDENAELFHTAGLDRAIQLVLTGLSRVARKSAEA